MSVADKILETGVVSRIVEGKSPRQERIPKNKIQRDWMGYEEAAGKMGITPQEVIKMIDGKEITGKIHLSRLYVSRDDVKEYRKKKFFASETLEYVLGKNWRIYTPSKHISGRRKIIINVVRYSEGRFGYEVNDVAAAFERDVSVIHSIIKKNGLVTETIDDKCYISVWSFRQFLEEKQKKPG